MNNLTLNISSSSSAAASLFISLYWINLNCLFNPISIFKQSDVAFLFFSIWPFAGVENLSHAFQKESHFSTNLFQTLCCFFVDVTGKRTVTMRSGNTTEGCVKNILKYILKCWHSEILTYKCQIVSLKTFWATFILITRLKLPYLLD